MYGYNSLSSGVAAVLRFPRFMWSISVRMEWNIYFTRYIFSIILAQKWLRSSRSYKFCLNRGRCSAIFFHVITINLTYIGWELISSLYILVFVRYRCNLVIQKFVWLSLYDTCAAMHIIFTPTLYVCTYAAYTCYLYIYAHYLYTYTY